MRFDGCSCRGFLSVSIIVVVAGLALAAGEAAAQGPAQPPAPGAPPPPAVFQNPVPPDQLAVLNDYAGQPAKNLVKDKRYKTLIKQVTPKTTYHYGRDMSIDDAMNMAMGGSRTPVTIRDGRYAMVQGAHGPYLRGRGFRWFDMQTGTALGVFYFQPTNGEPTPTLTVFSKQLTDTDLSMSQLPLAFAEDLSQWALLAGTPAVTPRYFIPANGKKYVLVHDEDYCDHPLNTPAPPASVCEQLNAEAADADMNAAYFMKEMHNAADAMVWIWSLGPGQVAWVRFRNATCGAVVACRIRVTRERTMALMGRR